MWGIELLAQVYIRSELDFVEVVEWSEDGDSDVPEEFMREHSAEREDENTVVGHGTKATRRGLWRPRTYDYSKMKLTVLYRFSAGSRI